MPVKHKRRMRTANRILIIMGTAALAFVCCMVITFWRFQAVPDVLIQSVLGVGGIESAALAAIKITKVRRKKEDRDEQDL